MLSIHGAGFGFTKPGRTEPRPRTAGGIGARPAAAQQSSMKGSLHAHRTQGSVLAGHQRSGQKSRAPVSPSANARSGLAGRRRKPPWYTCDMDWRRLEAARAPASPVALAELERGRLNPTDISAPYREVRQRDPSVKRRPRSSRNLCRCQYVPRLASPLAA